MLKHNELTLRRIEVFLQRKLLPLRRQSSAFLKIEVNGKPCETQSAAMEGPWTQVEPGYKYGPAYRTLWFRVTGAVPPEMKGLETAIVADVGGERTVWRDNVPWCGIDVEHSDFGWLEGKQVGHKTHAAAGARVEEYIQVHCRNAQVTVAGKEEPREELVEEVKGASLVAVDREMVDLVYDVEFALSLLKTIEASDPAYHTILRALNDVVNLFDIAVRDSIARGRKLIRDALGGLNGEFKHTIYPVGHAHLDTAWLWPLHITRLKMAHTTASQLRLLERYPEYVFAHSQASQYEWLELEYPKLFEQVKSAVADNRWEAVGSMWVEADCNLTGGESLVRQFLYGRRYFKEKLGVETQDMWLPDVFGYSAALPQILAKFNIKYFLTQKMSWNQFNKFPHHTFWWEGIDGTKVWTHFPPADTYTANCEPSQIVFSVRNYKDHARADQSLYVYGHGDGGGGPTEKQIEFLRRGRLAPNYPDVAVGKRAIDFFREAKYRSRDLRTWVGELYLELHRGTYTSQAANKRDNRYCEFLLRDAEWLSCFSGLEYPKSEIEKAWKLVLLNQFHDIIPGSSVREVYEDSALDYDAIKETGGRIIGDALTELGLKMSRRGAGLPVALFHNATSQTESSLPVPESPTPITSLTVGEEVIPVQMVEEWGQSKLIFATPAAAQGTVVVGYLGDAPPNSRARLKASSRRIENDQFAVRFDGQGNITGVESLEDGTEFIQQGRLSNLFQLFDDSPNFWSAWDIDVFAYETGIDLVKSESFEIVSRGPVRVAAEIVKVFGSSTIRQRISLGPTPGVRFDTFIDWHEEDKLLKVAFALNVNSPRATHEIQFGNVERPTHTNTSWDMAKFEVCAQKWVDLAEADQGVALINDGKYGYDVHGNVMRLSLLRAPKAPDPTCDMGEHRFTYVLQPHFGPYNHAGIVQSAYALNAPLRYAFLDQGDGVAGAVPPFIACDDRNIVIEAVKRAEQGKDLIVRLYECHNARGRAALGSVRPIKAASLCDLDENPLADLEIIEDQVLFDYKPFEIITLRLKT